jgi:15-cis-phytoene synthase
VRALLAQLREIARRHLADAQRLLPELPAPVRPAFIPLALVPLYLSRMEKADVSPFAGIVEAPQWRRQWALWRAAESA